MPAELAFVFFTCLRQSEIGYFHHMGILYSPAVHRSLEVKRHNPPWAGLRPCKLPLRSPWLFFLTKGTVGMHALINMHEYHYIIIHMRCWLMDN